MILVIGTGVAGLSCALAAAAAGAEVELVSAGELAGAAGADAVAGGNTALAQGGIAAAIGGGDSTAAHLADTMAAGAGLVDAEAAGVLVSDGAALVGGLLGAGFAADRDASGAPRLGLEAAHSAARIVHADGDRSGAVLHRHLANAVVAVAARGGISLRGSLTAVSLVEDSGAVAGALLCDAAGALTVRRADAVVLATGGYAALYPRTSNSAGSRGTGIVLAARAGAAVADLEFVQFHPTVLHGSGSLVSEAVRGAGAVLRDGAGRRFMADRDPRAELAPRDIVSREIHRVLRERGEACVWLDATGIEAREGPGALARRFPGISAAVTDHGLDWARDPIPVSPAAHYTMGGVASDLDGRSTVPGLFVAGELASTGVHGANRLASNSLLEGLVFGDRAGRAAAAYARSAEWELRGTGARSLAEAVDAVDAVDAVEAVEAVDAGVAATAGVAGVAGVAMPVASERIPVDDGASRASVARAVAGGLGIERDARGLRAAREALAGAVGSDAELAAMVLHFAESRTESRGAHQRADHPDTDPLQARRRAFRFAAAASQPAPLRTVHASSVRDSTEHGGTLRDGVEHDRVEHQRTEHQRTAYQRTAYQRTEQRSMTAC